MQILLNTVGALLAGFAVYAQLIHRHKVAIACTAISPILFIVAANHRDAESDKEARVHLNVVHNSITNTVAESSRQVIDTLTNAIVFESQSRIKAENQRASAALEKIGGMLKKPELISLESIDSVASDYFDEDKWYNDFRARILQVKLENEVRHFNETSKISAEQLIRKNACTQLIPYVHSALSIMYNMLAKYNANNVLNVSCNSNSFENIDCLGSESVDIIKYSTNRVWRVSVISSQRPLHNAEAEIVIKIEASSLNNSPQSPFSGWLQISLLYPSLQYNIVSELTAYRDLSKPFDEKTDFAERVGSVFQQLVESELSML